MTDLHDTAEELARMSKEERDHFVNSLVTRYPNLAEDISRSIEVEIQDNDTVS